MRCSSWTLNDIEDQKLLLREPKSGKEHEVVFIPQKLANRLHGYAIRICKDPNDRIFPISYEAVRMMVGKAGKMVGIHLRPHDLRRHAATYASRSGDTYKARGDPEVSMLASCLTATEVVLDVLGAITTNMECALHDVVFQNMVTSFTDMAC